MLSENKKNQYFKSENAKDFEMLKARYKEVIHSNRTYDRIKNISELVSVLQKRDALDDIFKFQTNLQSRKKYSNIASATNSNICIPINSSYNCNSARIQCPSDVRVEVYQKISSEIGRHWKEFGRLLSVSESEIDNLASKDSSDRVHTILYFHEKNGDPRKWRTELLKALVGCRRKDLAERVELIIDTHID